MDRPIGDVIKDNATRTMISSHPFELRDWQAEDHNWLLPAGSMEACTVQFDLSRPDRIYIKAKAPDGRVIGDLWLELQDNIFRVLAYDENHDEPVLLKCDGKNIEVDMSDRQSR